VRAIITSFDIFVAVCATRRAVARPSRSTAEQTFGVDQGGFVRAPLSVTAEINGPKSVQAGIACRSSRVDQTGKQITAILQDCPTQSYPFVDRTRYFARTHWQPPAGSYRLNYTSLVSPNICRSRVCRRW
jgi:hypothetical protein